LPLAQTQLSQGIGFGLGGHLTGNGNSLLEVEGGLLVRQTEQIQAPAVNPLTGIGAAGARFRYLLGQGNSL
jgi:hypothetical protein